MKVYTAWSQGHLDLDRFFHDQLWNPFALQFAAPTVHIDNCLGPPYYRPMYGPEMPNSAILYLRKDGVARAIAVRRLQRTILAEHVREVPTLRFRTVRNMKPIRKRMFRWLVRARAARNAVRADAWRATARDLMQRINGLTHDHVDMIVEHVMDAPEEPADSGELE